MKVRTKIHSPTNNLLASIATPAAVAIAAVAVMLGAVAHADAPKLPAPDDGFSINLVDAKWNPPKPPEIPPGAMVSPIASDPASGASLAYAKFPPGFVFPVHQHSLNEYTTLISGKMTVTVEGKAHEISAGGYITIPAKAKHGVVCAAGAECVLFTRRPGPTDYVWAPK